MAFFDFVKGEPPDEYICLICTFIAQVPYQVNCCGRVFCKECLDKLSKQDEETKCPQCRTIDFKSFKDIRVERSILNLEIYCTNKNKECQWEGKIRDTKNHICQYQVVPCTNLCGEIIERRHLETHLKNLCHLREHICLYCEKKGSYAIIISNSHLEECPGLAVTCPNEGCQEEIPKRDLTSHCEVCPKAVIPCTFVTTGCIVKIKQEDMDKHEEDSMKEHLKLLKEAYDKLKEQKTIIPMTHYIEKKENDKSWYSSAFYTSPRGYKMCLNVKANGDGDHKGTHVACYVHLMSGEYDDTLEWPFHGEITVELLNQLEDKNHLKTKIRFNESIPLLSRQKVVRQKYGVGRGYHGFISQSELSLNSSLSHQYLKDDTLYFRLSVAVTSKTKLWLTCT